MPRYRICILLLITAVLSACAGMGGLSSGGHSGLELVAESGRRWTGVAVSHEGRIFVCYPRWSDETGASVAELLPSGEAVPYPDAGWNTWDEKQSPRSRFVCVQSVYVDKENFLWILDPANPKFAGVVEGGPKLVKVDLAADKVVERYYFDEYCVMPSSYLNDVRVDDDRGFAYITDSGAGAIVVLSLGNGECRRLLEFDKSTKSEGVTLTIDGKPWLRDGKPPVVHADGIALDPDGEYLYYQALTGRSLYRIKTLLLRDVLVNYKKLTAGVELVGKTGAADGMIFGPDGKLYLAAIEEDAIKSIAPPGIEETVFKDRLISWPDSFAVGPEGYVYFTTSQIQLGANPPEPYRLFRFQIELPEENIASGR